MSEKPEQDPGTCENCAKAPATVHIRRVTSGEEVEVRLCAACAQARGITAKVEKTDALVTDPVALMFQNLGETEGGTGTCHGCGLTFSRFRETGRLGCAHCYEAFSSEMEPLLRRVHGAVRHTGKVPVREGASYDHHARLRRLNEDLERAIGSEDYERAAELRDLIQEVESDSSPAGKPES